MPYQIIKSPLNADRFNVYDDSGKVVAQGDYKGRTDDQILQAVPKLGSASPTGPKSSPADVLKKFTGEQLLSDPKSAKQAIEVGKGVQDLEKGSKELDNDVIKDLRSMAEGAEISDYAGQMKKKYQIDTGPMMWMKHNLKIPFIPGTDYANLMDLDKEKAFSTLTARMLNPYRKLVTGAAASQQELEKFIMPAMPQISDNDKTWEAKNNLHKAISVYNMRLLFNMQKAQGKDVSEMEGAINNTRMPGMDGKPMGEQDDKWVTWSLDTMNNPSASDQEKTTAREIMKTNGIDPGWIKSLPSAAKEHPEWFQGAEGHKADVNLGDAELRQSKQALGK